MLHLPQSPHVMNRTPGRLRWIGFLSLSFICLSSIAGGELRLTQDAEDSTQPCVAMGPDGSSHVAWIANTKLEYMRVDRAGKTLVPKQEIYAFVPASFPRIAVNASNHAYVVCQINSLIGIICVEMDDTGRKLYHKLLYINAPGMLDTQYSWPDIAIDPTTGLPVAMADYHFTIPAGPDQIVYVPYLGPVTIPGSPAYLVENMVALRLDSQALVKSRMNFFYQGSPSYIADLATMPAVAVDQSSRVHGVWNHRENGKYQIAYRHGDATNFWVISDSPVTATSRPAIAYDGRELHVAWANASGVRYAALNPSAPTLSNGTILLDIGDSPASSSLARVVGNPGIAADPVRTYLVWSDARTANRQIYLQTIVRSEAPQEAPLTASTGISSSPTIGLYGTNPPSIICQNNSYGNFELVMCTRAGLEVVGQIMDACHRKGLESVSVIIAGQQAITEVDGSFSFKDAPSGAAIVLTASKLGYQSLSRSLAASPGTTLINLGELPLEREQTNLAVAGRVLEALNRTPLPDVQISLDGNDEVTGTQGTFSFPQISACGPLRLTASRKGYASHTESLEAPAGLKLITLDDIILRPEGTNPVVTAVQAKYDGLFLSGASFLNEYTAVVDWGNGTPGSVEFYVNSALTQTLPADPKTKGVTATMDMGKGFGGSLAVGANKITVIAENGEGQRSKAFDQSVGVIPMPFFLTGQAGLLPFELIPGNSPAMAFEWQFPDQAVPATAFLKIPYLNHIGLELAGVIDFKYEILSGQWEFHAGGKYDSPKFRLGNWTGEFESVLRGEGRASQTTGISVDKVGLDLALNGEYPIIRIYVLDLIPGAEVVHLLDTLIVIGVDINSIQRLDVKGLMDFALKFTYDLRNHKYDDTVFSVEPGLKVIYAPNLVFGQLELYLSGQVALETQLQWPPLIKRFGGELVFGISTTILGKRTFEKKFYLFNGDWYHASARLKTLTGPFGPAPQTVLFAGETWYCVPIQTEPPGPIHRDYLKAGPEGLAEEALHEDQRQETGVSGPRARTLAAFQAVKGGVARARASKAEAVVHASSNLPGTEQAQMSLVTNVFPYAEPALAAHGQELMLVYVADTGSANAAQFTGIKWTHYDGAQWSQPAPVRADPRAAFAPRVAFDGQGDAIAVWEQVADAQFTNLDLTANASQLEITWSRWDRKSNAWTVPLGLTTNSYLDHTPLLCGPMANGDLLLVWTQNESNQFMGIGPAASPQNDQVLWSRWDPTKKTWAAPATLVDHLTYRFSQSLAGMSNRAVYAWTQAQHGDVTNAADQQVFFRSWTNGGWQSAKQLTSDTAGNRNVRAAVAASGEVYLVWQKGDDLVMNIDMRSTHALVRTNAQAASFADFALSGNSTGNLALLWEDMSEAGSDLFYSIYDPTAGSWSQDARLTQDSFLERSFAPIFDENNILNVAFNKVSLVFTNEAVLLEGGGALTLTNMPQLGQVDIALLARHLVKAVAIQSGDFTAQASSYLPGNIVALSTTVRNVGDLAITNVAVSFFDGDPSQNGLLITNVAIPGGLKGASLSTVLAEWVVPEPATSHVLYAVVIPDPALTDPDKSSHQQSIRVGGVDLAVTFLSKTFATNGSMRVMARVQNLGATQARNSLLALRRLDTPNTNLTTVSVPDLGPGQWVQVAVDLPAGTLPEGQSSYQLLADAGGVTGDVETRNNSTTFTLFLWVDSDADGMPDNWERAHGLDPDIAADALLDEDGDGMTNLAEYLAGTDPKDPHSYLKIRSIAAVANQGGFDGIQLTWGAMPNHLYTLQRSAEANRGFTNMAEHIWSTPPENAFWDSSATNTGSVFYRIKLE